VLVSGRVLHRTSYRNPPAAPHRIRCNLRSSRVATACGLPRGRIYLRVVRLDDPRTGSLLGNPARAADLPDRLRSRAASSAGAPAAGFRLGTLEHYFNRRERKVSSGSVKAPTPSHSATADPNRVSNLELFFDLVFV